MIHKNDAYTADIIIAADGVNSYVRSQFSAETKPEYAQYNVWRGILENCPEAQRLVLEKQIPYYVFEGGHLLLYPIPNSNKPGENQLNWLLYQRTTNVFLSQSPAMLSDSLLKQKLPTHIAELLLRTKNPFIQAIFDCELPSNSDENIVYLGDAATVLRPHTGSGVFKALESAITCFKLIEANKNDCSRFFAVWQAKQRELLSKQTDLARIMGELLVTKTPDWSSLTQETMQDLWDKIMTGLHWYATASTDNCV